MVYALQYNPCLQCGACCAAFRVSFFNGEANTAMGGIIPALLTEDLTTHICCMKGTNQQHPYCIALAGKIGTEVRCAIYEWRSSTCRGYGFHRFDNIFIAELDDVRRCNKARKIWNLTPLPVKTLAALPKKSSWK